MSKNELQKILENTPAKSYKDKVIRYYKYRILYLEDRLMRNNIHYEDESKL